MKFKKSGCILLVIVLVFSMVFTTTGAARSTDVANTETYEQVFPDPNFAELIAYHTNHDVSDLVAQADLDEITILAVVDDGNPIVEDLFDLSGISRLKNLEEIDLSGMGIASIPEEIGELSALRRADFSDNQIVYIANEISNLNELEELHLDNNRIADFPDGLSNLPKLTVYTNRHQDTSLGNIPVHFIPQSRIVFNENGAPVILEVAKSVPSSSDTEINAAGINLDELYGTRTYTADENIWTPYEELPIYTYEDSYVAAEGAIVQYGSSGELGHIWGDYEYSSNLNQYEINGQLPNGRFIGNFSEFGQEINIARAAYSGKKYGHCTTYGNNWPEIDSSDTASNTDPVPNRYNASGKEITSSYYGDRIGTNNNKLQIGDVALKEGDYYLIGYNSTISLTILSSDTNGSGDVTHSMRVRDIMGASAPLLDIWRWDNPEWFKGTAKSPNNVLFGQKYTKTLSFSNKNNYFTY